MLLRVRPGVRLSWRHWGCDWVAFDEASGDTHEMGELTACALLCLEDGPLELATLVAEVAAAASLPEEAIRDSLQEAIAQLTRLGLVDTVPQ